MSAAMHDEPTARRQTFAEWLKNHPQANNKDTLWLIQNVLSTVYLINDPEAVEAWLASDPT